METVWKSTIAEVDDPPLTEEGEKEPTKTECEIPCTGSIKVTIKDKPSFETEAQRLRVLRRCFDTLKRNAEEERRLRDIKTRIQRNVASKIMKKYLDVWRTRTKNARKDEEEQKEERGISEERRIEMFISAITERQRELMKSQKPKGRDGGLVVKESSSAEMRRKSVYSKPVIVESPSQCRLNAQKQIIEKQRAKLAEQNRIIEELKLQQAQKEISRATKETVDMAKETLTYCGQKTRRTLIQLMKQTGYR